MAWKSGTSLKIKISQDLETRFLRECPSGIFLNVKETENQG
jgi:hypothetical protein